MGWCSVADRRKKPEHDDAWWADQRHAYIEKNDILLSDYPSWEWVSPYDFWRTIFPEGFLQPRGEEVPWRERGGGHPNGIAIQITNRTKTVKTKTGRKRDVPVVERFTLTDDLDGVMERVVDSNRKNESVFCAPVSFFGKSRVAENARFLHAFAIDLDGVGVQELKNMLKQFRNGHDPKLAADKWVSLPQPTFLVNSGTGFHLYYVLDQPIPLVPRIVPFVQEIKAMLTDYIWRDTVSTLEDVQHQGIYQPFRMPGTPTKLNGKAAGSKIKDKYEAVAFVHNGEDGKPWRCSLDYLLGYAGVRGGKDRAELIELMRTAGRTPIERAKKLWPEWYQARIVEGKAPGRWTCKRDLYDWWLGEVKTKATDHHRYWCLNVLAAYAKKCGIPYEELEADARRRLAPALEAYRVDVRAYRREFAAVAKSAAGTDYSEFPRPRVPVPDDELAKYEPLAADAYIAAKTACDRLVDRYAVNLPDGDDLNDGSTGTAAASPAQRAHVQDRSIERSVGVRER